MLKSFVSERLLVGVELHPHGIASIFQKVSYIFLCAWNLYFFMQDFFLYLIEYFGSCNRNLSHPRWPWIQCKESGCNPVWVQYHWEKRKEIMKNNICFQNTSKNKNKFCIPKSFIANISQKLFNYKIIFVNSQRVNIN